MFELFVMGLREYWTEENLTEKDAVNDSIEELMRVLSEHYGKEVRWTEPEFDSSKMDEEISVDVIDDIQLASLHAVAAKLELDGNLDNFDFNVESPWETDVFDRLAELDDEASDDDVEKFCHLLSIGNNSECFCLPVDLPFVSQINIGDDDNEEDAEHECHCHGGGCHHEDGECGCHHKDGECGCHGEDGECECGCGCEMDDGSVDISSLQALRRELDVLAKAMALDPKLNIDDDNAMQFAEDDKLRNAKIAWYIMSKRIDDAMAEKLPLVIRFADEEDYDDLEDEVMDEE